MSKGNWPCLLKYLYVRVINVALRRELKSPLVFRIIQNRDVNRPLGGIAVELLEPGH